MRREIADLVVQMVGENPQWGYYSRIEGALANLGHEVARNTVKRILQDHGIDPAPERSRHTPWKTFLLAHWAGLAAADFFTVEVLTLAGLKRYLVFFVIELQTRRVQIAGIHPQPCGAWVEQLARTLTAPVDGFLPTARYLIHDRDPLYTSVVADILASAGIQPFGCRRGVRISTCTRKGLFDRSKRNVSIEWCRLVMATCASSRGSTSSTTTASETIRGSTTGFCSTGHRHNARPPPCSGATASADSSVSTIERPRDWRAY